MVNFAAARWTNSKGVSCMLINIPCTYQQSYYFTLKCPITKQCLSVQLNIFLFLSAGFLVSCVRWCYTSPAVQPSEHTVRQWNEQAHLILKFNVEKTAWMYLAVFSKDPTWCKIRKNTNDFKWPSCFPKGSETFQGTGLLSSVSSISFVVMSFDTNMVILGCF